MPDCVDFKLKTPEFAYRNKVWAYEDIFEHVNRGECRVAVNTETRLTRRRCEESFLVSEWRSLIAADQEHLHLPIEKVPSKHRFHFQ